MKAALTRSNQQCDMRRAGVVDCSLLYFPHSEARCQLIKRLSRVYQVVFSLKTSSIVLIPLKSKKAGRFEILLGFAGSHSIATRGLVSLSRATTPQPSCFRRTHYDFFNLGHRHVLQS